MEKKLKQLEKQGKEEERNPGVDSLFLPPKVWNLLQNFCNRTTALVCWVCLMVRYKPHQSVYGYGYGFIQAELAMVFTPQDPSPLYR